MLDLESAIKHCEEVVEKNEKKASWFWRKEGNPNYENCVECAEKHRQLAEWLKDYQILLKAIDDIRTEIKTKYESVPGVPWRFKEYDDGWVMALEWTLEIIDKHIGKESE